MKFGYKKQGDAHNRLSPWTSRPIIRLRLFFGDRQQAVYALIDSGADDTLFHLSLAETLGITSFERQGWAAGISSEPIPVPYQRLKLQLDGTDDQIEIEAGFIDSPGVDALLGQDGSSSTSGSALIGPKKRSKFTQFSEGKTLHSGFLRVIELHANFLRRKLIRLSICTRSFRY